MQGKVFDIQRFSLNDGPGIRTTIFLKGCSLRCKWCHNPEGIKSDFSVRFRSAICIHCGRCLDVCDCHHEAGNGEHAVDFERCTACGRCSDSCPSKALTVCGQLITPEEAVKTVLSDKVFYSAGGGVTFSGGEPLLQPEFIAETAKLMKAEGISVAIDTCGNVPWSVFEKTLPFSDLFLYDIKAVSPEAHKRGTGVSNERILKNLFELNTYAKDIWIRVPLIPTINDSEDEMQRISDIAATLSNVKNVTLIPYHTLGKNKYEELGLIYDFDSRLSVTEEQLEAFTNLFKSGGLFVTK